MGGLSVNAMTGTLCTSGSSAGSAAEADLADGGEEGSVGEVDPAVLHGKAVVRMKGVYPGGEKLMVSEGPGARSVVDLDRVLDGHGALRGGRAGEDGRREVVAEHRQPSAIKCVAVDGPSPGFPFGPLGAGEQRRVGMEVGLDVIEVRGLADPFE